MATPSCHEEHAHRKDRERARNKWLEAGSDPNSNVVMASGIMLDPAALTLGFARRFASYKRPTLLLQDLNRLKNILNNPWRPVQIIFAGKAHEDDQQSKDALAAGLQPPPRTRPSVAGIADSWRTMMSCWLSTWCTAWMCG